MTRRVGTGSRPPHPVTMEATPPGHVRGHSTRSRSWPPTRSAPTRSRSSPPLGHSGARAARTRNLVKGASASLLADRVIASGDSGSSLRSVRNDQKGWHVVEATSPCHDGGHLTRSRSRPLHPVTFVATPPGQPPPGHDQAPPPLGHSGARAARTRNLVKGASASLLADRVIASGDSGSSLRSVRNDQKGWHVVEATSPCHDGGHLTRSRSRPLHPVTFVATPPGQPPPGHDQAPPPWSFRGSRSENPESREGGFCIASRGSGDRVRRFRIVAALRPE